jgi:hypothetical protein
MKNSVKWDTGDRVPTFKKMKTIPNIFPILLILSAFGGSLLAPYLWFNSGNEELLESDARYWYSIKPELPGYEFIDEPLSDKIYKSLGTSNTVNGTFVRNANASMEFELGMRPDAIRVFIATWDAKKRQGLEVFGHTPDICWVNIGWVPVRNAPAEIVAFTIENDSIPFDCRGFQSRYGPQRELAVWTMTLNGKTLIENIRLASDRAPEIGWGMRIQARVNKARHFLKAVQTRTRPYGPKQFVRYSVSVDGDWEEALEQLREFAPLWLSVSQFDAGKTARSSME